MVRKFPGKSFRTIRKLLNFEMRPFEPNIATTPGRQSILEIREIPGGRPLFSEIPNLRSYLFSLLSQYRIGNSEKVLFYSPFEICRNLSNEKAFIIILTPFLLDIVAGSANVFSSRTIGGKAIKMNYKKIY